MFAGRYSRNTSRDLQKQPHGLKIQLSKWNQSTKIEKQTLRAETVTDNGDLLVLFEPLPAQRYLLEEKQEPGKSRYSISKQQTGSERRAVAVDEELS